MAKKITMTSLRLSEKYLKLEQEVVNYLEWKKGRTALIEAIMEDIHIQMTNEIKKKEQKNEKY
jgi:hypothetical protein